MHDGLASAGDGDMTYAAQLFGDATDSLNSASSMLGAWWAAPARVVPVLGQQARALDDATAGAADVSRRTRVRPRPLADFEKLKYQGGQISVDGLRAAQQPLDDAVASMDRATAALESVDSPWLLPPVRERVERFSSELADTRDEVGLAALGARAAPGLVGGDGTAYVSGVVHPAGREPWPRWVHRRLGRAERHRRQDPPHHRRARAASSTACRTAADRTISGPPEYLANYSRFRPAYYIQDVTLSPDFPSVAQVMGELYEQTTGHHVDGVIAADPYGLADLLTFTGPVSIDGRKEQAHPRQRRPLPDARPVPRLRSPPRVRPTRSSDGTRSPRSAGRRSTNWCNGNMPGPPSSR